MAVRQPAPKVTDSKNSSFFLGLALCQAFFVGEGSGCSRIADAGDSPHTLTL
jgi:hypothetical protein